MEEDGDRWIYSGFHTSFRPVSDQPKSDMFFGPLAFQGAWKYHWNPLDTGNIFSVGFSQGHA